MAQTPPPDPNRALLDLIVQLKDAKSPLARVRVIARAWRTVRALTPKQRYEIAVHLGLDGADDLIEAIATYQGATPPPELMAAVNEVQKMDPATVKTIAARVRNPRQRAEGIRQGLKAIEDVLAGPETPPSPSPRKAPAPETPGWLPKGASATPAPPVPPAPPAQIIAKPATSWPLREAPSEPKPAPAPVTAPAPAPPPPSPPPPAPAPVPLAPIPTPAIAAPAPPPPPAPPAPVPVHAGLAEHLGSIPALTARFRYLRGHLDQVRRLPVAELRALLEVFPDGWARRRALSGLIEEGVPARAADVLSLVDVLQSPRDRAWCLSTVADTRALSDEERSALLQAAATPAGRRRLELRIGER